MRKVDVAIIGCGPAGLSAAINVKARNRTLLLAGPKLCSNALHKAHKINNYLGLIDMPGEEMRQQFLRHVHNAGIEVTQVNISQVYPAKDAFALQIRDDLVEAKAIILTTGVSVARPVPGEDRFVGRGVSYCGTCDAMFYQGKTLAVGSDSAGHEDELKLLAEVASKIYYFPQYEVQNQLPPNVKITRNKMKGFVGDEELRALEMEDGSELKVDGVFLLKELMPLTQLLPGLQLVDKHIKTDPTMATNLPGVFAAGDVAGRPYQIAKAVGQGQIAGLSAAAYVEEHE